MKALQDELSNAMKDFQLEPDTTFRQTIEGKDENSFPGYEPKMALEFGQLEIEKVLPRRSSRVIRKIWSNKDYIEMLEVIKDNDQKLPLSIQFFEGKGKGVVALQKIYK